MEKCKTLILRKGVSLSSIISYSIEIFRCLYSEFSFPLNDVFLEGTDKKTSKDYINKNQKVYKKDDFYLNNIEIVFFY